MKHFLPSPAAVAATAESKTDDRTTLDSLHRGNRLGAVPSSNRFAGGVLGWLLAFGLCLVAAAPSVRAASGGTVVAWGLNSSGQAIVPSSLGGVVAVVAGATHTVVLQGDGTVTAWGGNTHGQASVPEGLSGVKTIATGASHTVALKNTGAVVAWGLNDFGQTTVPAGLSGVTAIAAGGFHTVALRSDGTVVAWGDNSYGQARVPAGLSGVTAIAAGGGHTMALKDDGNVVAWGADGIFQQTIVPAGLSGVTAIAAGSSHSVALKANGKLVAWGNDFLGQATVPAGLSGVTAIAAGEYHSVALQGDGTVVAWGWNDDGQTIVPPGLSGVTAIAAGWRHTAALIGPIILTQPVGQTFALGSGVSLSVGAAGIGLSYQWQFEGANLSGETRPTLELADLSPADAGTYRVVVSSTAGGTVTSRDTVLLLLSFGDLKLYAGMILTGTVGQRFRVDYADVVNPGLTDWLVLTNLALPFSPYLVIDPGSPGQAKRFYRAVPLL